MVNFSAAQNWIDQPVAVRNGETIDLPRLHAYLQNHLPDLRAPLNLAQFPQGFSNLTYLLTSGEHEFVLRRPPIGANIKSAHDMSREFHILSGLERIHYKAPQPILYCDAPEVIGEPFYLMQRVRGVILRPPLPHGLELQPESMQRICHAFIETLIELHALDYRLLGLENLARSEGYIARQIGGWTKRYENARTDDIREVEEVAAWLASHQPAIETATLIHNDYRYDNVVLDPNNLTRIVAVLDWEMATLGDPLMDVGTTLAYWAEAKDPMALRQFGVTSLPGNLNRQEFAQRYAERSGRSISHLLFYYVAGLFKLGVIAQQIYFRYRQGVTQDARFAQLLHVVRVCGQTATRAVEKNRIHHLYD